MNLKNCFPRLQSDCPDLSPEPALSLVKQVAAMKYFSVLICCLGLTAAATAQNLTVTMTAPSDGTTVSNKVAVAATASDDSGVLGVQFRVDGFNLGSEVLSAPYTNIWSTLDMSNGLHTVQAIARDALGNRATNGISVTVNNPLLPIPTNEWVAIYRFNEATGTTTADASWNGNTGTITQPAWTPQGRYGSCLLFDSTTTVTVNDSASLHLTNAMTLEAWVYPTNAPSYWATFILKETTNYFNYALGADPSGHPGVLISTAVGNFQAVYGPSILPINTWTHLAGTYDGAALKLFVNGQKVAEIAASGTILASSLPLRLNGNSVFGEYFYGKIDEVRIYNQALSQNQIQTDLNGLDLLTVTVDSTDRVYGAANPALSGSVTGLLQGDSITTTFTTVATPVSPVGNYPIVPSFDNPDGSLTNYIVITNSGNLAVTPAPLTVTALDASRGYGQTNPVFTVDYTGFVNGETNTALGGTLVVSSDADTNSPVGPYPITASGLSGGNYALSYQAGTLSVTNALLTLTANNTNKLYGQTVSFAGTEFTVSGLLSTDTVTSASLSSAGAAPAAGVAGSPYPIAITNAVGDDGLTNYLITYVPGVLTLAKADPTIVVTPYSTTYDASAHTASGTAKGVLNEALSGLNLAGTTHTAAGSYSADGWTFTDVTGNYNNAGGSVADAIAKANPAIVVTPYSLTYDASAHTASGTAKGVLNETLSGLNLAGTTHTAAGSYPADGWTFTDVTGNYNNAGGSVADAIAKKRLLAQADDKNRVFGQTNPLFTISYSGFVIGQGVGDLDNLPTASTTATKTSAPGAYPIVLERV